MIDNGLALEGVEKAVRKFLLLRDDDPVVRVMLAGILANFAPDRDVPVWLVIVGDPASAKTDLISLVQDWKHTWVMPDMLTEAYFFSSKTSHDSALKRIEQGGYRILWSQDMAGMMDLNRVYGPGIYQQLRGIHDGFLKKETGFDSRPLLYGNEQPPKEGSREPVYTPKHPNERLGWLGTATPEFYPWQSRHARLGTRFTCYLFQPFTSWLDYESLSQIDRMRAERAHWRVAAKDSVQRFLDMAIGRFSGFEEIRLTNHQNDRISASVKLVNRIAGTRQVTDTGARLHPRVTSMCRVMAFMAGRPTVSEDDILVGIDIVKSQLPRDEHKILQFALEKGSEFWPVKELLQVTGLTRRQAQPLLDNMVDVDVLESEGHMGVNGAKYRASESTRKLAAVFMRSEQKRKVIP